MVYKLLYSICWHTHKGLALKRHLLLLTAATALSLITGCGSKDEESGIETETAPVPTAATLGEQAVLY